MKDDLLIPVLLLAFLVVGFVYVVHNLRGGWNVGPVIITPHNPPRHPYGPYREAPNGLQP